MPHLRVVFAYYYEKLPVTEDVIHHGVTCGRGGRQERVGSASGPRQGRAWGRRASIWTLSGRPFVCTEAAERRGAGNGADHPHWIMVMSRTLGAKVTTPHAFRVAVGASPSRGAMAEASRSRMCPSMRAGQVAGHARGISTGRQLHEGRTFLSSKGKRFVATQIHQLAHQMHAGGR